MTSWRLVSDVGGSNVRFARSPGGHALSEKRAYALRDHASFYDALRRFLDETGGADGCAGAAIGVAGPVDDDHVTLTNADWSIETRQVEAMLGGAPTKLINDLQAVALALPYLGDDELHPIGPARRHPHGRHTMLALNVGTGFGGALCVPVQGGWITNPGEPGHMALGARTADELALVQTVASVEHLLSGRGVERLYAHFAGKDADSAAAAMSGSAIFSRAADDPAAAKTVDAFAALLGRIAGDLALASAAWGGVYLCGSVVSGWVRAGGGAGFRAPFEAKSAMTERMQSVYSGLITRDDVALVGLTYL